MENQRRRAKRVELSLSVEFQILPTSTPSSVPKPIDSEEKSDASYPEERNKGEICNLSVGGAFIHTKTIPPLLSRVALWILPKEGKPICIVGVLLWRRLIKETAIENVLPPEPLVAGFGLRFDEILSSAVYETLLSLCKDS